MVKTGGNDAEHQEDSEHPIDMFQIFENQFKNSLFVFCNKLHQKMLKFAQNQSNVVVFFCNFEFSSNFHFLGRAFNGSGKPIDKGPPVMADKLDHFSIQSTKSVDALKKNKK